MKKLFLLITISIILTQISCKKEQNYNVIFENPQIQTTTYNNAVVLSTITSNGGSDIISKGLCYSTSEEPSILNDTISGGIGVDAFSTNIPNLIPNTKYFVRTYARNSNGLFYSTQNTFTTVNATNPVLTTVAITSIASDNAISGGNITNNGGVAVTDRGVCWSLTTIPTISNSKISSGSGDGQFVGNITGLTPNTKYYVRAYATNSIGTSYGNEISFTTTVSVIKGAGVTDIDGNTYETYIIGSQEWMTENLKTTKFSNGDTIPVRRHRVYNDDILKLTTYGYSYEPFYITSDSRNVCPTGWKLPTDNDFNTLVNNFGGSSIAGGALKTTNIWFNPNVGATNSSKFSAVPGGLVPSYGNGSNNLGFEAYYLTKEAHMLKIVGFDATATIYNGFSSSSQNVNVSIRCIKQ